MARQPQIIPFSEGKPPDNLQVEDIGNNEVLVGEPEEIVEEETSTEFDKNIAEDINENELNRKAQYLLEAYENDKNARSEWEERYKQGLQTLDADGGQDEEENQRATRGLSTVVHPMIAEAATQFNARAIAEMFPSGGPVKTVIVGNKGKTRRALAQRTLQELFRAPPRA